MSFKVGDIITGLPFNGYSITVGLFIGRVISLISDDQMNIICINLLPGHPRYDRKDNYINKQKFCVLNTKARFKHYNLEKRFYKGQLK